MSEFDSIIDYVFKIIPDFLCQSAEVMKGQQTALVLSDADNAVQLKHKANRSHNILGLGTVFALVCSQPDTQFHSNKHEIDSKDQMQTACNWKCTEVGTERVNEIIGVCL